MIHNWFYRIVRRRMNPIAEDSAIIWKRRLSIAYGLIAWNAFGVVVYGIYNGRADWAHYYGFKSDEEKNMPPGLAWADTLGIKNAKVYRISGFKKVDEYQIVDGKEVRQPKVDENNGSEDKILE